MPDRSSISQITQLGVEITPGTAVAANRRLQALGIVPAIAADVDTFRPAGSKYAAVTAIGKESSTAALTGRGNYNEIVFPLSSVLTTPVVAQIMDGATPTGAYTWTWSPNTTLEDNPKTFTVEHGSGVRASRSSYGLVTDFSMTVNRSVIELGGSMIARQFEDGITLTASPTLLDLVPMLPKQFDVFANDVAGDIGDTKLGRALSFGWNIGGRFGTVWPIDSALASYAAHIETEPTLGLTLLLEADAAGMSYLDTVRNGDTKFLRLRGIGPEIYDGGVTVNYQFTLDIAAQVNAPSAFSNEDGVYSISWGMVGVHDADLGMAYEVEVINTIAAL